MESERQPPKGLGPLTALIVSPVIAGALAILYAVAFVAEIPGNSSSEIPRLFLVPLFFVLGFVMYFFIGWSPILAVSLLVFLFVPRRGAANGWRWFVSGAVFVLSLPVFYICLQAVLNSPQMRNFFPFNDFGSWGAGKFFVSDG